jgi:hypothetical protein
MERMERQRVKSENRKQEEKKEWKGMSRVGKKTGSESDRLD